MNNEIKTITRDAMIRDAITAMNNCSQGIVIVVDDKGRLAATLTDGDLRCAILENMDLEASVDNILKGQKSLPFKTPVSAPERTSPEDLLKTMNDLSIHHIPIIDTDGKVVRIITRRDLEPQLPCLKNAVIMAGGRGERLRPLTDEIPKPMLPIDGKPMLERIIISLRDAGVDSIWLTTLYKSKQISDFFGNGDSWGVKVNYVLEDKPLGTAGFLKKITFDQPTLVINGDVLTNVNFRLFYDYHRRNQAKLTVAVQPYTIRVPYGVLNMKGVTPFGPCYKCMEVVSLEEKPTIQYFVNAGIYILEPEIMNYVPEQDFFNMTDVIENLVKKDKRVASFPMYAYWRDVGTLEDYERAPQDIADGYL